MYSPVFNLLRRILRYVKEPDRIMSGMSEDMTVSDPTPPIGPSVCASDAIIHHTSSSSSHAYDVFVSFRGEDTRNNFTSFLFGALLRQGIVAFKDDQCIKKGDFIAPELLQAIQGSQVFVVVLSKNYASSTWCLRELVEILNCCQTSARPVIPIFYDVEPTMVRNQKGCYEKAFAEHENRVREGKVKMEEVQRWKEALKKVADISGSEIGNKPQNEQIEKIVQEIINNLRPKILNLPRDELVGVEDRVRDLGNILRFDRRNDVRVVGISGMGGIGKTTLARALYERICHQYNYRCYIDDVSKIFVDSRSLGLQKQLISQTLNEKNVEICNVIEGTCLVQSKLKNAKALIVFDNVDEVQQLRIFSGNRDNLLRECLGGGSRIIIVSRDEQILKIHGVDDIYQVEPLIWIDAIQLFCRNAFKDNYILSDYKKLADKILSHVQGHPLAIETIGSSLFGRSLSQWKSVLEGLEENKSKNIMDILRISYIQLEEKYKQTFLDIACFFHYYDKEHLKEILNFRGFHPEDSIQVLIDKSLITRFYGCIKMHRLLVDLGRCIVREVSPKEPIKWSRLWTRKDLRDAMSENEATRNLEAIVLVDDVKIRDDETIKADGLSKIKHLKLLKVGYVKFSGSLSHLSNELGYLVWHRYPFECLPQSFQPHKLVELSLRGSSIQRLWEGRKALPNLKRLDLSDCESLVEMPDVAEALNLERIILEGCVQLQKLNPSIGSLRKLVGLNLGDCKKLVILSNTILGLNSLKYLDVSGCSIIDSNCLLDERRNTEHLISCLSPSCSLSNLYKLDLSFCNLVQIPDYIGKLRCLEMLNLKGNNFVTLPNLKDLWRLYYLNLQDCKRLKYLPDLPSRTVLPSEALIMSRRFPSSILNNNLSYFGDVEHTGLIIFDCPELVEIEQCTTKSLSWEIQMIKAVYQLSSPESILFSSFFGSIMPGSQIPSFFNNEFVNEDIQYTEDEDLIVDPPPVPHDNNFVGVFCCVIFSVDIDPLPMDFTTDDEDEDVTMKSPGIPHDNNFVGVFCCLIFRVDNNQLPMDFTTDDEDEDVTMKSPDHICFYYEELDMKYTAIDRFCLSLWDIKSLLGYESFVRVDVKKFQYRWVNEEDLINLKMRDCANLTARKRKISVIEENG